LEVPTIYKAYVRAKFQGTSTKENRNMVLTYLHFRILKFPLTTEDVYGYYFTGF
jgi:hypothetical protein